MGDAAQPAAKAARPAALEPLQALGNRKEYFLCQVRGIFWASAPAAAPVFDQGAADRDQPPPAWLIVVARPVEQRQRGDALGVHGLSTLREERCGPRGESGCYSTRLVAG